MSDLMLLYLLYVQASAASGFDDCKTDPFVTKDPFANETTPADDPFRSHDPFTGSSNVFSVCCISYTVNICCSSLPPSVVAATCCSVGCTVCSVYAAGCGIIAVVIMP